MRKALLIYSKYTGTGSFVNHIEEALELLRNHFVDLEVHESSSLSDLYLQCQMACGYYEYLIFSGGDGTFNKVINAISTQKITPILAYIPSGTINDAGKNFGMSNSWKKAIKAIISGTPIYFDVGEINGTYFSYVACNGIYSEIPYITKREPKKKIGRLAYYLIAIKDAFKKYTLTADITADGIDYHVKTPFILIMNSTNVGGFNINPKSDNTDGKFDIYLTKPGLFNGLLHYLFFKVATKHIVATSIKVHTDASMPWDIDGEEGMKGDVSINVVHNRFRIVASKRVYERILKRKETA